ncbi:MAG: Crp/Fnr family transcriptional regulator [Saprospiraceae bacterium]
MEAIERKLPPLPFELRREILEKGILQNIPAGTEILREGQYIKVIPIVLEGSIKVFSSHDDKELLLYYIEPTESCVMSFSAGLWNAPSRVRAVAEEDTETLLLPVADVNQWVRTYPKLNELFFQQFNQRYDDLLHTIHQLLFEKMDKRLMDYLTEKSEVLNSRFLDLRHHQIAREMGSAREVISRVMKKLEKEKLVKQHPNGIEIL